MYDVLFIMPSSIPSITEECEGTLLLATILKNNGINSGIYRLYEADKTKGFGSFIHESVENILNKNPRIVSFYCRCDCLITDIMIAKELKEKNDSLCIVFGGPQADASCEEIMRYIPWVDYCCRGEGEETIYPLFSALLSGEDPTFSDGLVYRDNNGGTVINTRPALIKNLDNIPNTDYSFVEEKVINSAIQTKFLFPIEVGRGCPFNCAYCSTSLFWNRKYRLKSPQRILSEMKRLNSEYGIKGFAFNHDLFTANKKSVLEFCEKLKESDLEVIWGCSSRIDTIDEEMIDAMVTSGFKRIYFGIETGSPRMQKIIHKNLDIQRIIDVCTMLTERNVGITASFIYGFPEETEEDIELTMRLVYKLMKIGVKDFQFHLCAIFPGTEYYEKYKSQLIFAEHHSDQVSDFGVKENYDFICEHKDLFPFYYEYHNPLRKRFAELSKCMLAFLVIYEVLIKADKDKFASKPMVEMYLELVDKNRELIMSLQNSNECVEHIRPIAASYLSTVYDAENLAKLDEIFAFKQDTYIILHSDKDISDIKIYNADIKGFTEGKPLSQIEAKPSTVIFRKQGKTTSWIIRK